MIWQSLPYLNLLWLLLPLGVFFIYARHRRQALLCRLAAVPQLAALTGSVSGVSRVWKGVLFMVAVAVLVVALARPSWNKSHQPFKSRGRDVVFVLDISRSMLAAHRSTTRLEEAKFAIQECLKTVRGDRVALVIFAGNAKVACPLTHDYAYFLTKLGDVDYRSVTFGGTMLGDALRLVCTGIFKTKTQLYRDVIVITDGEDMQSNPLQAAEQLAELNARLIAVGMGDTTPTELVITLPDGSSETLKENGSPVMTRLDTETLRAMTEATPGGVLIPVPSDTLLNLNEIYKTYIDYQVKKDFETHEVVTYEDKFQLFVAVAMVLLVIARLLPERRRLSAAATVLMLFMALPRLSAAEENADVLVNQARAQIEANELEAAQKMLTQALQRQPEHPIATYNQGILQYRQGKYEAALESFQRAGQLVRAQQMKGEEPVYPQLAEACSLAAGDAAYQLALQPPEAPAGDGQQPVVSGADMPKRVEHAKTAVKQFQKALELNPRRLTTRDNLNTAKLAYKQLLRQQKMQQQQQQQQGGEQKDDQKQDGQQQQGDQKKEQPQNGDQKDGQQQEKGDSQQEGLKNLEQRQRQAAQNLQDGQQKQDDLKQEQQELSQAVQQALEKQQKQGEGKKNQRAEDYLKEALAKQQQAGQELEKEQREAASQSQKEAADLTKMAQQALEKQEKQEKQEGDKPQEGQLPQQQAQQPQEAQQGEEKEGAEEDARAMDAINQEAINRQKRQKRVFTVPGAQNKDW